MAPHDKEPPHRGHRRETGSVVVVAVGVVAGLAVVVVLVRGSGKRGVLLTSAHTPSGLQSTARSPR